MSAGPGATMRAVLALVAERPRRRCALARPVARPRGRRGRPFYQRRRGAMLAREV